MNEQKKEFADLEFNTLKSEILKLIIGQKIPVFCDKYNQFETSEICDNAKFDRKKVAGGGTLSNSTDVRFHDQFPLNTDHIANNINQVNPMISTYTTAFENNKSMNTDTE